MIDNHPYHWEPEAELIDAQALLSELLLCYEIMDMRQCTYPPSRQDNIPSTFTSTSVLWVTNYHHIGHQNIPHFLGFNWTIISVTS